MGKLWGAKMLKLQDEINAEYKTVIRAKLSELRKVKSWATASDFQDKLNKRYENLKAELANLKEEI